MQDLLAADRMTYNWHAKKKKRLFKHLKKVTDEGGNCVSFGTKKKKKEKKDSLTDLKKNPRSENNSYNIKNTQKKTKPVSSSKKK